jgi:hypothetical protein
MRNRREERLAGMFASRDGLREAQLEAKIATPPALTRPNVIAVI